LPKIISKMIFYIKKIGFAKLKHLN